jgi:hypothetical protein
MNTNKLLICVLKLVINFQFLLASLNRSKGETAPMVLYRTSWFYLFGSQMCLTSNCIPSKFKIDIAACRSINKGSEHYNITPWRWKVQCLPKRWITFNIRRGSFPKAKVVQWTPAAITFGQEYHNCIIRLSIKQSSNTNMYIIPLIIWKLLWIANTQMHSGRWSLKATPLSSASSWENVKQIDSCAVINTTLVPLVLATSFTQL